MAFLEIEKPEIALDQDMVKIIVKTTLDTENGREENHIWYEVDSIYKEYLYSDRIDAFLVALLPYCMTKGIDIKVSDQTGVSADLLFQIRHILIPSLVGQGEYKEIKITANSIQAELKKGTEIAVGVSRGVDSSYVLLKCLESGECVPTVGALFNVQAYGDFGGEIARDNFSRDVEKAEAFLNDVNKSYDTNIQLITVDSNIQEIYKMGIKYAGTFRDTAPIILLRQLIKVFHVAATHSLDKFSYDGQRKYESWIVSCLNTEGQRIHFIGIEKSRLKKIEFISKYPVTYNHLFICRKFAYMAKEEKGYASIKYNCTTECEKCRYTVAALIALDKLENYEAVFDLESVNENYDLILKEVIQKGKISPSKDIIVREIWEEIYELLKEHGKIDSQLLQEMNCE